MSFLFAQSGLKTSSNGNITPNVMLRQINFETKPVIFKPFRMSKRPVKSEFLRPRIRLGPPSRRRGHTA